MCVCDCLYTHDSYRMLMRRLQTERQTNAGTIPGTSLTLTNTCIQRRINCEYTLAHQRAIAQLIYTLSYTAYNHVEYTNTRRYTEYIYISIYM